MTKITPVFFILFLYSALPNFSQSRKVIATVSKEICNCLEKSENIQDKTSIEAAMESCVMKASLKNIDAIKKELNIDMTQGEDATNQFGEIIAFDLIKRCDIFLKYIMSISIEEEFSQDTSDAYKESSFLNPDLVPYEKYSTDSMSVSSKACSSVKNATYRYVTDNPDKKDYFILDGKKCTEFHDNGKYVSNYEIKWKENCEFVATFINSTNPEVNNLLSKGDKVNYQILGVYADIVYLNLDFKGFSKTFKLSVQK